MCVVAGKYIKGKGWVGVKNRDRNYKPIVSFIQSKRGGIERLLLKDMITGYTEGMNEHGICIISSATLVKDDEEEIRMIRQRNNGSKKERIDNGSFVSVDGLKIRTALLSTTLDETVEQVKELKVLGNHLIFDKDTLFIVEINLTDDDRLLGIEKRQENPLWTNPHPEYDVISKKVKKGDIIVRTNHGFELESAGYQSDEAKMFMDTSDPEMVQWMQDNRVSSEKRYDTVSKLMKGAKTVDDMLTAISDRSNSNPQHNPLRTASRTDKKSLRTTGQVILIPSDLTMLYRNIWGTTDDVFNKVNSNNTKTNLDLLSYKEDIYESSFEYFCETILKGYS